MTTYAPPFHNITSQDANSPSPTRSAPLDLTALHAFAAQLAIEAGSYLREQAISRAYPSAGPAYDLEMVIKENAADLVTKADLHAEQLITSAIKERYPEHQIIGEESYSAGQAREFLLTDVSSLYQRRESAEVWCDRVGRRMVGCGVIRFPHLGPGRTPHQSLGSSKLSALRVTLLTLSPNLMWSPAGAYLDY